MEINTVIHGDSLDIPGYEGIYTINNKGDIFNSKGYKLKNQLLKSGYYSISLSLNGKINTYLVHRLIGQTFIENKKKLKCINHINGIKTDNRVENIEWCTHSQNNRHAYSIGLKKPYSNPGITNKSCKPISQNTLSGEFIKKWGSAREIHHKLGFNYKTISKCCNGYTRTSHGFIWKFI